MENKLNSRSSQTWPYPWTLYGNDPSGRRVMKETNPDPNNYEGEDVPSWEFYFYTIDGQRLVTIDCNNANAQYQPNCWPVGENTYFGGKMLVSNGVYVVTDRLGSVRANTQGESFAYYPYGEERTNRPDGRDKFATYFRDTVGLDYAEQRYFNAGVGRFWSPDSTGGSTANPGSLNKYAYSLADPININDPLGMDPNCGPNMFWDGEGCTSSDVVNGSAGYGQYGSPCGSGWMTDASLSGPCQDPCSGDGSMFGENFMGSPSPGCSVPDTSEGPPAPAPPPTVSLRETSACTQAHGQLTGNFTLDVTYQLLINGAAITGGNSQMSSLGIYYVSEQLANETGGMAGTPPGAWCQSQAAGACPSPGDLGELSSNGTFTDYLSGQGALAQSFYLNGIGAPLQVTFGALGFVGPLQSYTVLNNTYNSRRRPPSVTVAGGALSSAGLPSCN